MNHPKAAELFLKQEERAAWHDQSLWFVRTKRDQMALHLPEWEALREAASKIKSYTVANLGELLQQFEAQAAQRGIHVHWAIDGQEHNQIVHSILQRHNVRRVVKSKSMLTEECGLNPYLEQRGIDVVDTDLGEWIVQLRDEPPSHIVMPAIHMRRQEVGRLFHEKIGTPADEDDPLTLTRHARQYLRQKFLECQAGITGVNFAIADTGGVVVCTNEGNADLGTVLPPVHIACMGMEKLIPRLEHLGVFLRLLARSATGQPITTYSSHFLGPRPGGEMHVVILDNGRSDILAEPRFRRSLNCIRCGACMNTCPVYRRSGGHSYGTTVPGPIGSIITPLRDPAEHRSLPFACTLCGSCTDVCPVNIDLHHQLLAMRQVIAEKGFVSRSRQMEMKGFSWLIRSARRFERWTRWGKTLIRILPRWVKYNPWNKWGRHRELPPMPRQSFRQFYQLRAAQEESQVDRKRERDVQ